jgi:hypothetical protein
MTCENFPYGFKGARSAPDPDRPLVLDRATRKVAPTQAQRRSGLALAAVSPGTGCALGASCRS